MQTVRSWCDQHNFSYQFVGDELFDGLDADLLQKTAHQRVIATDLARLRLLTHFLDAEFDTVVWLDADFCIFSPASFVLPATSYAVGREVWVQHNERGVLKVYKKVHNAFLMFRKHNPFLAFYLDTAERMLRDCQGPMPPQFIGPKLLTALHNVAQLPVMETAGMLSPLVINDILTGGGPALQRFCQHSPQPITGANLCSSSCVRDDVSDVQMSTLIAKLLAKPNLFG
ncbi:MAG: hypothetical protein OEW58_01500 [Gammaproteobacteria bacterium]|nr:hypothetical protein [Gammaproteobacteria bacterium]